MRIADSDTLGDVLAICCAVHQVPPRAVCDYDGSVKWPDCHTMYISELRPGSGPSLRSAPTAAMRGSLRTLAALRPIRPVVLNTYVTTYHDYRSVHCERDKTVFKERSRPRQSNNTACNTKYKPGNLSRQRTTVSDTQTALMSNIT